MLKDDEGEEEMDIIIRPRGGDKTTELISLAEETDGNA
jgi:hypothetical protein